MFMRTLILLLSISLSAACAIEYRVPLGDTDPTDTSADPLADSGTGQACSGTQLACGGQCVETVSNPAHCGGCNQPCGELEVCDAGVCASSCTEGRSPCSQGCFDLITDADHCGECSEQCDVGGSCNGGDCIDACNDACDRTTETCVAQTCECRSEFDSCGGECVDLQTNPLHCGECDRECGDDPCGSGDCQPQGCGSLDQCGGSCVDLQTDPLHCRECDRTCDGDEDCLDGQCRNQD